MQMKLATTVAAIILSATLVVSGCSDKKQEHKPVIKPVKSMVVTSRKTTMQRIFPGVVQPNQEAVLSFEVSGQINDLPVLKGEQVNKGALLASLNPQKYEDRVKQAQAKFTLANSQYERGKELVKDNYISQADYDKLLSRYEIAKADLSTAKKDLADTRLYAPFRGVVSNTFVDKHEQVQAKQKILNLHDITHVDIAVNVPENVLINMKKMVSQGGKRDSNVYFSQYPDKHFPVKFKEIATEADPSTQTYSVIFTMPQPSNLTILPGMSANVDVLLPVVGKDSNGFFEVPSAAVFVDENDKSFVWVINPDSMTLKKTPVSASRMSDGNIRIDSGLNVGDRIVTAGVHFLQENQTVRLLDPTTQE